MISLRNAAKLEKEWGIPTEVVLQGFGQTDECVVRAFYKDGAESFEFTGFSWGYGGEGPRGLCEFLTGLGFKVSMDTIAGWPTKDFGRRFVVALGGTL